MTADGAVTGGLSSTASHLQIAEHAGHYVAQSFTYLFDLLEWAAATRTAVYVLLLLLPLLVGAVRVAWPLLEHWAFTCWARWGTASAAGLNYIERSVVVKTPSEWWVDMPNHNELLLQAVLVYVCDHLWRESPVPQSKLRGVQMRVFLMDPYRTWGAHIASNSPFLAGDRMMRQHVDNDPSPSIHALQRLRPIKVPLNAWVPTTLDHIDVRYKEDWIDVSRYAKKWQRQTLTLRCPAGRGAAVRLDGFVQRALEAFAEGAPSKEPDAARWFFTYGGESDGAVLFNPYVLRSNKGFDTLFFPRRDATLALIDHFTQRRGRFAVEGFPQKLGFLVYGPAGTGRHAFVKALAAYTGRHVVSVPLSKLRTNQQLYDVFFVREFKSEADGKAQRLRMEDVIFLFDDVDAADSVVCARARRRVVQRRAAARLTAHAGGPREAALTNCVVEMDTSASRPVVRAEESGLPLAMLLEMLSSGEGGAGASAGGCAGGSAGGSAGGGADGSAAQPPRAAKGQHGSKGGGGGADAGAGAEKSGGVLGGNLLGMNDLLSGENKDKLDLAGLLNVLDGVVDAPGRMVVMITEHPEWLDPALVRPGRFSARLRFDYMEMEALVSMLGLYYGDVVPARAGGGGAGALTAGATTAAAAAAAGSCGGVGAAADGAGSAAALRAARQAATAAAARVVHRELSAAQVARVRGVVAALEAEAAAAAAAAAAASAAEDGSAGSARPYRFQVTPCEVEMLCMEQDDLESFLTQLAGVVRGTVEL